MLADQSRRGRAGCRASSCCRRRVGERLRSASTGFAATPGRRRRLSGSRISVTSVAAGVAGVPRRQSRAAWAASTRRARSRRRSSLQRAELLELRENLRLVVMPIAAPRVRAACAWCDGRGRADESPVFHVAHAVEDLEDLGGRGRAGAAKHLAAERALRAGGAAIFRHREQRFRRHVPDCVTSASITPSHDCICLEQRLGNRRSRCAGASWRSCSLSRSGALAAPAGSRGFFARPLGAVLVAFDGARSISVVLRVDLGEFGRSRPTDRHRRIVRDELFLIGRRRAQQGRDPHFRHGIFDERG